MSPSVDTRTWGTASPVRLSQQRPFIVLVVLGLLSVALLAPRLGLPANAPPLTIHNPTAYTVFIEASDQGGTEWTPVAVVSANHSEVENDVIDEGPVWKVRFTSQGIVVPGYQVTRAELAAHDWSYTVPADVAVRLQAGGAPPSP
jgi:hypothetical protein